MDFGLSVEQCERPADGRRARRAAVSPIRSTVSKRVLVGIEAVGIGQYALEHAATSARDDLLQEGGCPFLQH